MSDPCCIPLTDVRRALLAAAIGCEFHGPDYGECAACSSAAERVWDDAAEQIVLAERDALLAKFEALAAEFHVAVISAGVEGDYVIGYGNGMGAARNALSNLIKEARA